VPHILAHIGGRSLLGCPNHHRHIAEDRTSSHRLRPVVSSWLTKRPDHRENPRKHVRSYSLDRWCPQSGTSYENVAGQGVTARGSVRKPARRGFPLTSVMRPTSVASEADMKPGNRKGTNPGPPDRTGRTNRTAFVLKTTPHVLNSTAANCGPPFGTKRPQVQILSPRLYSRIRGPYQSW
jgi:hypothetical protein